MAAGKNTPAVNGSGLRLTIIPALQWEAQQACEQQVSSRPTRTTARSWSCSPAPGKILAMAQSPAYNPASVQSRATTDLAVQDMFEPGSTAKVITAAAAMEHGGQTITSTYTVPDQIVVDGYTFHDAEYHPAERWTIAGILAHSSNVGMVQVVRHVPPQTQYDYLRAFGIGSAHRPEPARRIAAACCPRLGVVGRRAVHAVVRPGRRGHRGADGQRLRDDRERRGAGPADHRGRAPPTAQVPYTPARRAPSRRVIQARTARS